MDAVCWRECLRVVFRLHGPALVKLPEAAGQCTLTTERVEYRPRTTFAFAPFCPCLFPWLTISEQTKVQIIPEYAIEYPRAYPCRRPLSTPDLRRHHVDDQFPTAVERELRVPIAKSAPGWVSVPRAAGMGRPVGLYGWALQTATWLHGLLHPLGRRFAR